MVCNKSGNDKCAKNPMNNFAEELLKKLAKIVCSFSLLLCTDSVCVLHCIPFLHGNTITLSYGKQ
jgi:hypothetical protein